MGHGYRRHGHEGADIGDTDMRGTDTDSGLSHGGAADVGMLTRRGCGR